MLPATIKRAVFTAAASPSVRNTIASRYAGFATIFALHHVVDDNNRFLDRGLAVTAGFLDAVIDAVLRKGCDIVSLSTLHRRMQANRLSPPMVVFTFDDGYANNLTIASKIFEKHRVPWSLYLTTGFPDRTCDYWWRALERFLTEHDVVAFDLPGLPQRLVVSSLPAKRKAFRDLCRLVQQNQIEIAAYLRDSDGLDVRDDLDEDAMSWSEIRRLLASDLFELGAHTVNHPFLSSLTDAAVQQEIVGCRQRIRDVLGVDVAHFSYPFGSRAAAGEREYAICNSAGYATAATTIQRSLYAQPSERPHALPRVWLDGRDERLAQIDRHLSGVTSFFTRLSEVSRKWSTAKT